MFKKNNRSLKFFHLNAQSLLKKRSTLENLINDLGANTIFGFSDLWTKTSHDKKLWQIGPTYYKTFRTDREAPNRENGGGVMQIIPACLNPKTRNDLNYLINELFESLWIEWSLNHSTSNKQKRLINTSYNPKKAYYHQFLEKLSMSIDHAVVEIKPLTMMGDYNINYLNQREKEDLETVILPYGLKTISANQPTRKSNKSGSIMFIPFHHLYLTPRSVHQLINQSIIL